MSKANKLDLSEGTIWKVLLIFILPILAGSLIQQLYTTVDAVIVGKFVGKSGLAAIDSVATLFKFPINFLSGLSSGATIVISRIFGSKNEEELDCAIHTAFTIAIIIGVGCSLVGFLLAPQLMGVMAVPEEIQSITLSYCRIYFLGLWTITLYNMVAESFSGACCGMGDTLKPMITTLLCTCGLRVVCIFFVLPKFQTMDCIVDIYIASWIVTGLAFLLMFLLKSRKMNREVLTEN